MPHPIIHANTDVKGFKTSPRKTGSAAISDAPTKNALADKSGSATDLAVGASKPALPHEAVDTQASFFDRPLPTVMTQNPTAPMPAAVDSKLWAGLSGHMRDMNQRFNYDRMANTNAYGAALKSQGLANAPASPKQLVASYPADSSQWLREEGGGNCVGLCGHLMNLLKEEGLSPTLIGSSLKGSFAIKGGPPIGHVAVLLSADVGANKKKQLLLEPGFNFSHPIVLPDLHDAPVKVDYDGGKWVMTRKHPFDNESRVSPNEVHTYIIPKPDPDNPRKDEDFPAKEADVATYFLKPLDKDPESITRDIVAVDKRPIMLARDPEGNMVGLVALDYGKRTLTLKVKNDSERFSISKFKEVAPDELPTTSVDVDALAEALNTTPKALAEKLHTAVNLADTLHPKLAPNAAPPPKQSGKKKKP